MQRLAAELGVGTMTIYGYFPNKDALLAGVVDAATAQPGRVPRGGPWRDELAAVTRAVHNGLARHPALVQIRLREPIVRPDSLRFGERAMGCLLRAGLLPPAAAAAFRLLFTYVFGEAAMRPSGDLVEARRRMTLLSASLPAERFPVLTEYATEFGDALAGEDQFESGLELILDGIHSRIVRGRRSREAR